MTIKEGQDYKDFAANEIRKNNIKSCRDFSCVLRNDYIYRENTRRGVLVIGLKSTGKSIGIYQATFDYPSDKIFYLSVSGREEDFSKSEVLLKLKEKDYDLIIINEYSWLKEIAGERDALASYLAGKAGEGVKVIISGTDSTLIHALLNTDFIHRAIQFNTTYFLYDEYCRIHELEKSDKALKDYLIYGCVFEKFSCELYDSLKEYINTAIVENLDSYYSQYNKELIEFAVYKIFYECICGSITSSTAGENNRIECNYFLQKFGVRADIKLKPIMQKEILYKLEEIGVVAIFEDDESNNRKRLYIMNQSISAQLIKCIYGLTELSETYLNNLLEASVICCEYMKYAFHKNGSIERLKTVHRNVSKFGCV